MLRLASILTVVFAASLMASDGWPEFRGPTQQGHSDATGLPVTWSETENVTWKTPIPGKAWSTPAILGRQVWLTTATPDGTENGVVCIDRETGKIVFERTLWSNAEVEPLGNDVNSYGSPSPLIEPGRVYVHFGSYGTAALDTETFEVIWQRRDLPCQHFRGPGSSPIIYRDLLILTMDGVDYQYLVALDKHTGKTVWKTDRTTEWDDLNPDGTIIADGDFRKAYSTPIVFDFNGKPQMVSVGAKAAYSYDPVTGKELWHVTYRGFSNASRPVYADGLVLINTGYGRPELIAVRPAGSGDVTDTVVWSYPRAVPKRSSPVVVDDLVYMVNDAGVATCLELKNGEAVWKQRLEGGYSASPIYADGRLYFCSEDGKTVVLQPGRKFKVLAENELADGMMASPAVAGQALYLRTKTHLYRIEK